jgi:hypothetical protein
MAITTVDGALAGMQPARKFTKGGPGTLVAGRLVTYWAAAGAPGGGGYNGTLNGVTLSSTGGLVTGQIPHYNPVSGNAYLARFVVSASQAGVVSLADRLWHNGGINPTLTTPQAIVSPAWPARDVNGSSDGDGVLLALEVSAATGSGTPTITVGYTNSDGVAGRTATTVTAVSASSTLWTMYLVGLQAGDTGVRSVESITLSVSWSSGTINLVAYREIVALELSGPNVGAAVDIVTGGFQRIYDGTVPYVFFTPNTTTNTTITGSYVETWG